MRIALAICVALGSALCGRASADAVRRRAKSLAALAEGLRVLRIHMTGMLEPVQLALERSDCALLNLVGQSMGAGCSAEAGWRGIRSSASRRGEPADALTQADLKALDRLFAHLGQSGIEEQEALLSASLQQIGLLEEEARRRAEEADKLYGTMGLLIGLMLAIIVI